ncbi:HAMP domain-containing protein [Chloroflexi bacterium CFX2]|nr:MAG: HAMP domain-containing protein [Chloroflexota bacterium]MDL1942281.1 HAMP domain-containing protein [Chloroflexi bacterium CFX2]
MNAVTQAASQRIKKIRLPIATKLTLSFLSIILLSSLIFTIVGIQLINNRIIAEAQDRVRNDLNAAREIYQNQLEHVEDAVEFTTVRLFMADILRGDIRQEYLDELTRFKESENLDVLTITDAAGKVILRVNNPTLAGDDQSHDEIVAMVLKTKAAVSGTTIISAEELQRESPSLAQQAHFVLIDTPMAKPRPETETTSGMMLKAAAPVFDAQGRMVGVVYGGILLNRNYAIVDKIKQTIFQGVVYEGKDIGTATIFQDDVRISTNVKDDSGARALGTRIAADVYDYVMVRQATWVGRAYVVTDWYITAYEPIRNISGRIIGILYVGILEQKYTDIQKQTVWVFVGITLAGAALTTIIALWVSRQISNPIRKLVAASEQLAEGNLDVKLELTSGDELGKLSYRFNQMAEALRQRDERLKEFTKRKIMESERLAIVGQLAANVAHELNNPLQGIVTYSSLLLEKNVCDDPSRQNLEKIAIQANRCREIIRGLLDFSRQKKPQKSLTDINALLRRCVSLVENQALFHNIAIVQRLDESLPMIVVDPSQIERVFLNLIINAAEAMNGGTLTLTTTYGLNAKTIEIEVKDTGHGISIENMERIFNPFFTTKEIGHGVGLGLAISYGIVKEHNGEITVESEIGKGAKFIVSLPVITKVSEENGNKVADFAH